MMDRTRQFVSTKKTLHQRMVSELERFDAMPKELRRAYSECDYGLLTPKTTRYLDVVGLIDRISGIKSQSDADEFNAIMRMM